MVFDPISWAIGSILTATAKHAYASKFKSLSSRINSIFDVWEKKLPENLRFNVEALCGDLESPAEKAPNRECLGRYFERCEIPSTEIWLNALLERWKELKHVSGEARGFFTQPEEEVLQYLKPLSNELERECASDQELFQISTYQQIAKLIEKERIKDQDENDSKSDLRSGLDNTLISEISIAGYVSDDIGTKRALYLDKDAVYVNRIKAQNIVISEIKTINTQPDGQWLSIVGDAGHGKSSLLWYLFNEIKKLGIEVFCILAQISGKNAITRIERALPYIEKKSVILLDTLDLIVGVDDIRLARVINACRQAGHFIITTSRRQEIRRVPLKCNIELELDRYSDEEAKEAIRNYIRACYPTMTNYERSFQFDNVWGILDARRRIQELDLEPLILSMIFQAYAPTKIPQDIDTQKVYREFWNKRVLEDRTVLSDEDRQTRIALCLTTAWCIVSTSDGADSFSINDLKQYRGKYNGAEFPHDALSRLVSSGILHWALGGSHVRFFHQTFLEYAAAVYIRTEDTDAQEGLLLELLSNFDSNFFRWNPIVKQIAIQAYYEGSTALSKYVINALTRIHSLHSLQISLEIGGKIGIGGIDLLSACKEWISEDPSLYATTVCEIVRHYPKQQIPLALQLLKLCLATHEETGIYTLCGDKLAFMDAIAVHSFLRQRLQYIISHHGTDNTGAYFKKALIGVFSCGVHDSLQDLLSLYPIYKGGQQAGLLSSLAEIVGPDNVLHIARFCSTIVPLVIDAPQGEVRHSFTTLLTRIAAISKNDVMQIAQEIYDTKRWFSVQTAALFTGLIIGRFLLDTNKIRQHLESIDSPEPHARLLGTWALQQADSTLHQVILTEILKLDFAKIENHPRKLLFKIVATLTDVAYHDLFAFVHNCPWPEDEVFPDEFRQIFVNLADKDDKATAEWLMSNINNSGPGQMRSRQLMNGIVGLILRDSKCINIDDLRRLYQIICMDDMMCLQFAKIAGIIAKEDPPLATHVFTDLLQSKIPNVRTSAIHSLKYSIDYNLPFTFAQGDKVLSLVNDSSGYGLLHCLLHVLRDYNGSEAELLLKKVDFWFSEEKLASISDETTIIELLTFLKVYGCDYPYDILNIARRCRSTSQGLCGALSEVYSNVAMSIQDGKSLSFILEQIMIMANYNQRHIRHAVRKTLPVISRKIGHEDVFKMFFAKYPAIESNAAFESLVRVLISIPEWSYNETQKLLDDANLPPQVRSVLLSKTGR